MRLSSKIIVDQSHYSDGKKYYRRCTHYYITEKVFCECCGIQLRTTPMISTYKRILKKKLDTVDQKAAGRNNIPGSGSRIQGIPAARESFALRIIQIFDKKRIWKQDIMMSITTGLLEMLVNMFLENTLDFACYTVLRCFLIWDCLKTNIMVRIQ